MSDSRDASGIEQAWWHPVALASALGEAPLALNVATSIGFNAVWTQVMGTTDRRPTADDTLRMRDLLEQGLKAGAYGVSAGLDYKPAY